MLDALVPSLAKVLRSDTAFLDSNPYFISKKKGDHLLVQLFPRMESFRIWSELRGAGECGLTPDEVVILTSLLMRSTRRVDCVTDYPTDDCIPLQIGRHQYFRAKVPAAEFLTNLRSLNHRSAKSTYLPRSSLLEVDVGVGSFGGPSTDLREWCYLRFPAQEL